MHQFLTEQELRYGTFSGIMTSGRRIDRGRKSAKRMYFDDAYDGGLGYIGPLPTDNSPDSHLTMQNLKRQFTPSNKIKEVVDRVVDALLSRSPNWEIFNRSSLLAKSIKEETQRKALQDQINTANSSVDEILRANPMEPFTPSAAPEPDPANKPSEEEQLALDEETRQLIEAEMILSQAWQNTDLKENIKKSLVEFLLTGDAKFRTYVRKRYKELAQRGFSDDEILIEAVKYIGTEHIDSGRVKIFDDDGDKMSVARLEKKFGNKIIKGVEVTYVDSDYKTYIVTFQDGSTAQVEGNFNDDDLPTVIKRVKAAGGQVSDGFSLNEHILVEELKGEPFVTNAMIQQNRALNLNLTLGVGILVENGFAEMFTANAELEKEVGEDEDGAPIIVTETIKRGPSTATNLIGVQYTDEKGNVHYEKPTVTFMVPTPIVVFVKGESLYYKQILSEARQEFVLMVGDSMTTGESRIQSRQDFLKKVQQYKNPLDKMCSNILTTFLHLAASISGKDDYFKGISVNFDSKISAGELSAAEQQVIVSRYQAQLISRETALVMLGTEDPLIEIDKIRLDEAEAQQVQIRRLAGAARFSMMNDAQNPDPKTGDKKKKKGSASGGVPGV